MKNLIQKIGAGLLLLAFIFYVFNEIGLAYAVLIFAGIIDIYLVIANKMTISQWIQDLTSNKLIDYAILIVLWVATFFIFFNQYGFIEGMRASLPLVIAFLALHLFADKN